MLGLQNGSVNEKTTNQFLAFYWLIGAAGGPSQVGRGKKTTKRNPGTVGPGVTEVSFRAGPHRNMHRTLGVDTGAIDPR
jgi:hypothetical protein